LHYDPHSSIPNNTYFNTTNSSVYENRAFIHYKIKNDFQLKMPRQRVDLASPEFEPAHEARALTIRPSRQLTDDKIIIFIAKSVDAWN